MAVEHALAVAHPGPHRDVSALFYTFVLAVLALLVLYPLFLLVLNSFQTERPGEIPQFTLENWRIALSNPGILSAIHNTLTLRLIGLLLTVPLGIFLAWLLARTDLPGRDKFEFLFWIAFFLPPLAVTQGWILMLDPQYGLVNQALRRVFGGDTGFNLYSWWGIVWVHLVGISLSIKVMLMTPAFRNMDASLEDASQICGAGRLVTLCKVIVPLMAPTVLIVVIVSLIRSLESFEIELILGAPAKIDVYGTKIYRLINQDPPSFGAATALSIVILAIMLPLVAFYRWYTSRRKYTTVTGQYKGQVLPLRGWKWPAFAFVSGVVCLLVVVPLTSLLMGTFMRLYGFFHLPEAWTLSHWRSGLGDPLFLQSLWNTVILATAVALGSVILVSMVAYIIVRTRFWGRGLLDYISWLLFALPGIILGLCFLWLFLGIPLFRPLYGSMSLLVLAGMLGSMTLGVQIVKGTLLQLGGDLEEASWTVGGSRWRTCRSVLLPILTPVLLTVGMISFISAARNVGHMALLATSNTRPLALMQLDYMAEGRYEEASVIGIVIVALTIGVALVARTFGLRLGLARQ